MIINNEAEALVALEAVVAWAHESPGMIAVGGTTGVTAQRERIVATRVLPDETLGVSTYKTVNDAKAQTIDMERGYREWRKLVEKSP